MIHFICDKLHELLRSCSVCGSFDCGPTLLCSYCEKKIAQKVALQINKKSEDFLFVEDIKVPLRYLLSWDTDLQKLVESVIRPLKNGDHSQMAFDFYAHLLMKKVDFNKLKYQKVILAPAPSKKKHAQDHAYRFAEAMQKQMGARIYTGLSLSVNSLAAQKTKRRHERLELKMNSDEKFTEEKLIFVDDIVTSGGTASAAYKALGRPRHFEVWCLARRPLSLLRL